MEGWSEGGRVGPSQMSYTPVARCGHTNTYNEEDTAAEQELSTK